MTIAETERIGGHIQSIRLSFPARDHLTFEVGCYILPMIGGCVPRAYSIAEFDKHSCRILVSFSRMGVGARTLSQSPVGTPIKVYGPFSDFPYRKGTGRPKLFLATGTGVAPFRLMVEEARRERMPAELLLGAPERKDLAYDDVFRDIATAYPHFHYVPVLSRPDKEWTGRHGYITSVLEEHRDYLMKSDVYVCGVPPMVESVKALIKKFDTPRDQLFIQKFG